MEDVAPMLVAITMFISTAAVLILRPLSKQIGELLVQMRKDRAGNPAEAVDVARLTAAVEHLSQRLQILEDRQEFTEQLLHARRSPDLLGSTERTS